MNLRDCKTREEVEAFFDSRSYSKDNYELKYVMLMETMNNPQFFFSVGNPTQEQKYEMILSSFLSGTWKYADKIRSVLESK